VDSNSIWWWNNGSLLGPFTIQQFGDFNWFIASSIKVIIALTLVVLWIIILSKIKNWIFRKEIKS